MPEMSRPRPMMATLPFRLSRFLDAGWKAAARLRAGVPDGDSGTPRRMPRLLALVLRLAAAIRRPGAEIRHRPLLPDLSDHLLRDIGFAPDQVRRRAGP